MVGDGVTGKYLYFGTVQPEWKNLAFASEVIFLLSEFPDAEDVTEVPPVVAKDMTTSVRNQLRFLEALEVVEEQNLTANGRWLVNRYKPPEQQSIAPEAIALGRKSSLSRPEQEAFCGLLVGHHWFPMLATAHQLEHEQVQKAGLSNSCIQSFSDRLCAVEIYSNLSDGAWETRAKVHYEWFRNLGLARRRNGSYELTSKGEKFHQRAEKHYPREWAQYESMD